MPLYVRENSLLPMGTVTERPDYDYTKDLELHFYLPSADGSTCRDIVDVNGNVVTNVEASRHRDAVKFDGLLADAGWKIILHNGADEITTIMAKGESMQIDL
jgi:alpha-D-xyloside xylohydrolase